MRFDAANQLARSGVVTGIRGLARGVASLRKRSVGGVRSGWLIGRGAGPTGKLVSRVAMRFYEGMAHHMVLGHARFGFVRASVP